jgi:hypothetical protein
VTDLPFDYTKGIGTTVYDDTTSPTGKELKEFFSKIEANIATQHEIKKFKEFLIKPNKVMTITKENLLALGFDAREDDDTVFGLDLKQSDVENGLTTEKSMLEVDLELELVSLFIFNTDTEEEGRMIFFNNIQTDEQLTTFVNLLVKK